MNYELYECSQHGTVCAQRVAREREGGTGDPQVSDGYGLETSHNSRVDLAHDLIGLGQNRNDPLVVLDVVAAELLAFAVLKPLLGGLIAADGKVPGNLGHTTKVLLSVDPYLADFEPRLFDLAAPTGSRREGAQA
jgi:hypothetical protein